MDEMDEMDGMDRVEKRWTGVDKGGRWVDGEVWKVRRGAWGGGGVR